MSQEPVRILIAEDDPVLRDLAIKQLHILGYAGMAVKNGLEALAALEQQRFVIVLMDVAMPELDGIGATRLIRELDAEREAKQTIIGVTGQAQKAECIRAGMDDCVIKPMMLDDLRKMLDKWLPRCA